MCPERERSLLGLSVVQCRDFTWPRYFIGVCSTTFVRYFMHFHVAFQSIPAGSFFWRADARQSYQSAREQIPAENSGFPTLKVPRFHIGWIFPRSFVAPCIKHMGPSSA